MKHFYHRLLHHYCYNLKLKSKLFISHTLLFLLPAAVLAGFLILRIYNIVLDDTLHSEQALINQAVIAVENRISHVSYAAETLSSSLLMENIFHIPKEDAQNLSIPSAGIKSLTNLIFSLSDHSLIRSITVFYDDNVYEGLDESPDGEPSVFVPLSSVDSPWLNRFLTSSKDAFLFPSESLSPQEKDGDNVLALITRIPYAFSGRRGFGLKQTSAFIAIYFYQNALEELLSYESSIAGETSFLMNSRGSLAAASDLSLARAYLPQVWKERKQGMESGRYALVPLSSSSSYLAYFPISGTDWYLISIIPHAKVAGTAQGVILQFSVIYGLISLFAILLSFKLSKSITDRIIHVAHQMETVRTGRPQPFAPQELGNDEIGVLSDTYNYMAEEINLLMDSQEKAAENIRKAEFCALQAQINPHFLYNTLDMINWLAQSGRIQDVTQAVQALTRFYKLTLGRRDLINTIEDELNHVSLYMKLQNMRYDDCAAFLLDVPAELYDYTIPKLTFQPLVENALLHGIMAT